MIVRITLLLLYLHVIILNRIYLVVRIYGMNDTMESNTITHTHRFVDIVLVSHELDYKSVELNIV